MSTYGYVRVSTKDQNEARQIDAMRAFGVRDENIIIEKISGKDFQRPLYNSLVANMKPRDVLVIKSIDRLGRNYEEILNQWSWLTKTQRIGIVVLDMPLLDTREGEGRDLTGVLIADIVLQLLSYVAQTERENILRRQAEGIAAAKARGVRFGRPRLPLPKNFPEVCQAWLSGELPLAKAASACNMPESTFYVKARRAAESDK